MTLMHTTVKGHPPSFALRTSIHVLQRARPPDKAHGRKKTRTTQNICGIIIPCGLISRRKSFLVLRSDAIDTQAPMGIEPITY